MILKMAIVHVVALIMLAATHAVHADIGRLTINGQEIPANLYDGIFKGENWCPPTSDARVRDQIINTALIVFAGRQGNFALDTSDQKRIAEKTAELERAKSQGVADVIAKAAWGLYYQENSVYGPHLYPSVSELFTRQDALDEYKRLIETEDPRLTDVVTGKYMQLTFPSNEEAQRAIKLLNAGKSLTEVTASFDEYKLFAHNKDNWFIVDKISGFTGDPHELESGKATLATSGQMWFSSDEVFVLYFDEVLERSRLRPFTKYNNSKDYAFDLAKYDLWAGVHDVRRMKRWQDADIREDGKPVVMNEKYPDCP